MTHYIYMLECSNGQIYTGYTTNIERRYQEHQTGSSKCKFTRSFPPKRLAACWAISGSRGDAMALERKIKQLSPEKKRQLAAKPLELNTLLEIDYTYSVETRK